MRRNAVSLIYFYVKQLRREKVLLPVQSQGPLCPGFVFFILLCVLYNFRFSFSFNQAGNFMCYCSSHLINRDSNGTLKVLLMGERRLGGRTGFCVNNA